MIGVISNNQKLYGRIGKPTGSSKGDHITVKYSIGTGVVFVNPQVLDYEILDDYPTEEVNV